MIELIKELRAKTLMGMADCKKALEESNGNMEEAITILRKRGLRKVEAIVEALEGEVRAATSVDGYKAILVEVNCQTDFGARSEVFQKFLSNHLAKRVTGEDVNENDLVDLCGALGETVKIRREYRMISKVNDIRYFSYNHPGGKIAVVVGLSGSTVDLERSNVKEFAENTAMHIAAASPLYVHRVLVPQEILDKKKDEFRKDLPQNKKPEQLEQILQGKVSKWFSEVVLLDQESLVQPGNKIEALMKKLECSAPVELVTFVRFERGEQL